MPGQNAYQQHMLIIEGTNLAVNTLCTSQFQGGCEPWIEATAANYARDN